MRKVIITGGPHTGKTTLLEALKEELPEVYFVPEPAERVIARENAKEVENPTYNPIVPVGRFREFAPLVIQESIDLEAAIPENIDLAILDRSIIDTVAFALFHDCADLIRGMHDPIRNAGYSLAFMCDPVGSYKKTDIRHESSDQALKVHLAIKEVYADFCDDVVLVPAHKGLTQDESVQKRVELIRQHL